VERQAGDGLVAEPDEWIGGRVPDDRAEEDAESSVDRRTNKARGTATHSTVVLDGERRQEADDPKSGALQRSPRGGC
jgi:hypothetical protein